MPKREDLFMDLDIQDHKGDSILKVRASSKYEKNLRWLRSLLKSSTKSLDGLDL